MKLNIDDIRGITQGAQRVEFSDGGIKFFRFNREEETLYLSKRPDSLLRTYGASGICLEFETDASTLYLDVTMKHAYERHLYFAFDIFVNGVLADTIQNFEDGMYQLYSEQVFSDGKFEKSVPLGTGNKTVTIYLPWYNLLTLNKMELENCSYINPVKKEKTLITYGDSITQGYDVLHPSGTYAVRLAKALDAQLYNKAIGSEVFFPELARIKSDIDPDYITVAYGTNDWKYVSSRAEFESNCTAFYIALKDNYPNAKIFAITPIWRKNYELKPNFASLTEISDIIAGICEGIGGITVINGFDFVPHSSDYFADLTLHPNDMGAELYARNLEREIKKYL